jgi:hypothetical protein
LFIRIDFNLSKEAPYMLDHALALARRGIAVFPLQPKSKIPFPNTHGCLDASKDEQQIAEWWSRTPDANIGIATGAESGLWVLDIDGDDGIKSLQELMRQHGMMPRTWQASTGNGFHLYFQHPGGRISNSRRRLPGIDTRGDGGYVVAPPSIHPSGSVYHWSTGSSPEQTDLAPEPPWVAALVFPPEAEPAPAIQPQGDPSPELAEHLLRRAVSHARHNRERHPSAVWLAKQLQDNCIPQDQALHIMLAYQSQLATVPWNPDREMQPGEVRKILDHVYTRFAPRQPWTKRETSKDTPEAEIGPQSAAEREIGDLRNHDWVRDGKKDVQVPRRILDIWGDMVHLTNGWPKRTSAGLFVINDQDNVVNLQSVPDFFAWLHSKALVNWSRSPGCITKEEFSAFCRAHCEPFDSVETTPHFPPRRSVFYHHPALPEPTGEALEEFLSLFCPATTEDYYLIKAFTLTIFAGLPYGSIPVWVVDSDYGQGTGKSELSNLLGELAGGIMEFRQERPRQNSQPLATRLLAGDYLGKRIARYDNVRGEWDSSGLESIVTQSVISGHALYKGENTRPNSLIWVVTNNGTSVSEDLAQRSIIIKLGKRGGNPGTWRTRAYRLVHDARWDIISDIGRELSEPSAPIEERTRFGQWERAIIGRLPQAQQLQEVITERQNDASVDQDWADEIKERIESHIRKQGFEPDYTHAMIQNRVLVDWYREATGQKFMGAKAAIKEIRLLCLRSISELSQSNTRHYGFRGFRWAGRNSDRDRAPVLITSVNGQDDE